MKEFRRPREVRGLWVEEFRRRELEPSSQDQVFIIA